MKMMRQMPKPVTIEAVHRARRPLHHVDLMRFEADHQAERGPAIALAEVVHANGRKSLLWESM